MQVCAILISVILQHIIEYQYFLYYTLQPLIATPDVNVTTNMVHIPEDNPIVTLGDTDPSDDNMATPTASTNLQDTMTATDNTEQADAFQANLPEPGMNTQQPIDTYKFGDTIRVDNMKEMVFFVKYPNGDTTGCKSSPQAGGIYHIDYQFQDGNIVMDENGLPEILMKTPEQYQKDTPIRDNYLGLHVSYTMHTGIILVSCIINPAQCAITL